METLLTHKKARLLYELLETFEAGLVLLGGEVKALRQKKGKLEGAHVVVRGAEPYIIGMSIPPYQVKNTAKEYDAERARKILLTQKEIAELAGAERQKGLTVVPIMIYNKGRYLKVQVAIARGKKKYDKREDLKKRDAARDIARELKRRHG